MNKKNMFIEHFGFQASIVWVPMLCHCGNRFTAGHTTTHERRHTYFRRTKREARPVRRYKGWYAPNGWHIAAHLVPHLLWV